MILGVTTPPHINPQPAPRSQKNSSTRNTADTDPHVPSARREQRCRLAAARLALC